MDLSRSCWVFPVNESKGKRQPRIVYLSPQAEELTKRLVELYPVGGTVQEFAQEEMDHRCSQL